MAKPKPKDKLHLYAVFAGFSVTLIPAVDIDDARKHMLINMGYERKPWVGENWVIRRATAEDRQLYGGHAGSAAREKMTQFDFEEN